MSDYKKDEKNSGINGKHFRDEDGECEGEEEHDALLSTAASEHRGIGMTPYEYDQSASYNHQPLPSATHPTTPYNISTMEEDCISDPVAWNNELFSCFSGVEACLLGTFCPCVSFGRSTMIMRTRDTQALANPRSPLAMCNMFSAAYYVANALTMGIGGPVAAMWRRYYIRKRYGIQGNVVEDAATHFFCHCCALVQEDKEVLLRESERRKVFDQEQEFLANEYL